MEQDMSKILELIKSLDLPSIKKQSLIDRIKNKHFSKKLFQEIEELLQGEIKKLRERVKNRELEQTNVGQKLKKLKEENNIKKQNMLTEFRNYLKKLYQEFIKRVKSLASKIDKAEEDFAGNQESQHIQDIKKGLGL